MPTTPNMNLLLPTPGVTSGPQYGVDQNNAFTIVDGHNHTSGYGVQVPSAGLNIDSDLSFNTTNILSPRTVRFSVLSATPAGAQDLDCLYVQGVDLYYIDGAGNNVRMTQSGSVSGSAGTITGLPSGTASAAFAAGTFVFQSATATSAVIDGGSFILRNNTASSKGLTLSPPNAMAADYTITLPSLPASTRVLNIDTSGNMGTITYDGVGQAMTSTGANAIASSMTSTGAVAIANNITAINPLPANTIADARVRSVAATVGVGGVAISSSSGNYQISGDHTPVTNLSVTITIASRPVMIMMIPDASSSASRIQSSGGGTVAFSRNGTETWFFSLTGTTNSIPPSCFAAIDTPGAGTYTYTFTSSVGTGILTAQYMRIIAYEL